VSDKKLTLNYRQQQKMFACWNAGRAWQAKEVHHDSGPEKLPGYRALMITCNDKRQPKSNERLALEVILYQTVREART
jgi:hypothetical protein